MADETENVVVHILRELQVDMADVKRTLARHSERFERVGEQLDEFIFQSTHTLGMATGADIKSQAASRRATATNERLDELTARLEELEKAR